MAGDRRPAPPRIPGTASGVHQPLSARNHTGGSHSAPAGIAIGGDGRLGSGFAGRWRKVGPAQTASQVALGAALAPDLTDCNSWPATSLLLVPRGSRVPMRAPTGTDPSSTAAAGSGGVVIRREPRCSSFMETRLLPSPSPKSYARSRSRPPSQIAQRRPPGAVGRPLPEGVRL